MNWKAIACALPMAANALTVIPYEAFIKREPAALVELKAALFEQGIVGIKEVPNLQRHVERFIESARAFSALPEEVKQAYAPNRERGDLFLGYEEGKERFQRPDGTWIVDDLKVSYYAFVPDSPRCNLWPLEMDLKTPFLELGSLMSEMGEEVMRAIDLIGPDIELAGNKVGRLLYYRKSEGSEEKNPFWCGAHFDNGLFTTLLPARYFLDGREVPEPEEAGLFVRRSSGEEFQKVEASDVDLMLFQVGEFGQLVLNDGIKATEHRVHKAKGAIERYTMALFFAPVQDTAIHSTSVLTNDARYEGGMGAACTYQTWHVNSFNRYLVK